MARGKRKPPLTHFLCLPLVTPASRPQLEASLDRFREDIASNDADVKGEPQKTGAPEEAIVPKVHPKAIRPVGALHCTLGVMSLKQGELSAARAFVESLDVLALLTDASKPAERRDEPLDVAMSTGPLIIDLRGLESMHPTHKTSILYSVPSDATDRLYPFCVDVQQLFKNKGFLVQDDRKLKLHATIINTIYAKGRRKRPPERNARQDTLVPEQANLTEKTEEPVAKVNAGEDQNIEEGEKYSQEDDQSQGHGPKANAPLKIDARAILEYCKDFVWAETVVLDRIAICEMGAKKKYDADGNIVDEAYTEVASVALPTRLGPDASASEPETASKLQWLAGSTT